MNEIVFRDLVEKEYPVWASKGLVDAALEVYNKYGDTKVLFKDGMSRQFSINFDFAHLIQQACEFPLRWDEDKFKGLVSADFPIPGIEQLAWEAFQEGNTAVDIEWMGNLYTIPLAKYGVASVLTAHTNDRYPHSCPACGGAAWLGFGPQDIECSESGCKHGRATIPAPAQ